MRGEPESWCVIGGGMLGQALALKLAREGKRVSIFEAAPEMGGLAAAWTIDGITWDKFYHVILPADFRTLGLLREIGLEDAVLWRKSGTGFFADGRMSSLDSGIDYLRMPLLGPFDKIRLAFTLMMAARIRNGRPLEQVSVEDWLAKWSGRRTFDRLWRPLLRAKLGQNASLASAAFIWATIRRLYLARSAGAKTEVLGFVDGGYNRVMTALRAALERVKIEVRSGYPVESVEPIGRGFRVKAGGAIHAFDRVVSTLPSGPTARICPALDRDTRSRLEGVIYQGILCASLVLDRPLGGKYLTYLADEDLPFTAIVEMSALTGTERFGGRTLVYLPRYVARDDPYWQLGDDEIRERFVAGLRKVFPEIGPEAGAAFHLARVRDVMAVPTLGYSDRSPPVVTNVAGFHIVNSAQITDGTLNVDATLGVVERALPDLLSPATHPDKREAA
jgi:protoporphyrinogen oxidase